MACNTPQKYLFDKMKTGRKLTFLMNIHVGVGVNFHKSIIKTEPIGIQEKILECNFCRGCGEIDILDLIQTHGHDDEIVKHVIEFIVNNTKYEKNWTICVPCNGTGHQLMSKI